MYGLSDMELKPSSPGMETESVKSISEHGSKVKRSKSHNHRSSHRSHSHKSSRNHVRGEENNMAPFQTAVMMEENRNGQEVIDVQIIPQDDNWGENTTAITGNTSDQSGSIEEVNLWTSEPDSGMGFPCSRYIAIAVAIIVSAVAFISPVLMIILPKIVADVKYLGLLLDRQLTWKPHVKQFTQEMKRLVHMLWPMINGFFPSLGASLSAAEREQLLSCGAECRGIMVSLSFKLFLLGAGAWALFVRKSRATLPCIFMFRAGVLLLVFICTFTFWLFYVVQITEGASESATGEVSLEYKALVSFSSSLTDTLLFIHYLAVVLLEIRHLQPSYYVQIVRSPDGESRSYAIGNLSIQRAAVWILDKYYTEFPVYNPYLERIPVSKSRKPTSSFKYYEVDGVNNSTLQNQNGRNNSHSRRRDSSHNERFYEEHDYERRVKKRKARLVSAAEEAFTHIKRLHHETTGVMPMDSHEAAQAVFPSLARALQKYLRVTRQQPRHSVDSILHHLAQCLSHDLSPRAFLEKFLHPTPVLQNEKEQKEVQSWSLICDQVLSQPLKKGAVFQLRQNDVSLLCTVHPLPHFNVTEEVIDPASNRKLMNEPHQLQSDRCNLAHGLEEKWGRPGPDPY